MRRQADSIRLLRFAAAALLGWLAAIAPSHATGGAEFGTLVTTRNDAAILHVEGLLLRGDAARIIAALRDDDLRMEVAIGGGFSDEAMVLGDEIRRRKLALVVTGMCYSACAQYLVTSSPDAFVAETGIVVFHYFPTGLIWLAQSRGLAVSDSDKTLAERERKFLLERAINPDIMMRAQLELGTTCVDSTADVRGHGASYRAQFDGWVPNLRYLAMTGIHRSGWWPKNLEDITKSIKLKVPSGRRFGVKLSTFENIIPDVEQLKLLSKINRC